MTDQKAGSFRPDIQGLRAVAVLAVIAFHAGLPVPGGFVGVDIFFVISGFVITGMLHREWIATGAICFRRFYVRRFKRLTPALAVFVSVTLVISILLLSPVGTQQVAAKTGLGAMFIVANFVIASVTGGYFQPAADLNPLLNTWSLSVEEQFYLVFPALLALGWWVSRKLRWGRSIPGVVVMLVAVVSLGGALLNAAGQVGPRTEIMLGFYGPVSRAWEFAIGALLALSASKLIKMRANAIWGLAIVGVAAVAVSLWLISDSTPFPGPWTLLPVLGAAALIAAGIPARRGVSALLATKPMVAVGDYSYSLYLWHWPFIVFAGLLWPQSALALALAATLATLPAIASYRLVEQRYRFKTFRSRGNFIVFVTAIISIPCVLALGLWAGAARSWGIPGISAASTVKSEWEALAEDCMDLSTTLSVPSKVGAGGCTWNEWGTGVPVYLVGDSAAAQFLAGVKAAAARTDSPLQLISAAHCPFTAAMRVNDVTGQETDDACTKHNTETMALLAQAKPGVVLLANSNRYWYVGDDRFTPASGARDVALEASGATLEQGIASRVRALQTAGQQVVLVDPTYTFLNGQMPTPERMPLFRLFNKESSFNVDVSTLEAGQLAARNAVASIAERTAAPVLDVTDWQCPRGQCPAFISGIPVYADSAHISQPASAQLASRFSMVVKRAASAH